MRHHPSPSLTGGCQHVDLASQAEWVTFDFQRDSRPIPKAAHCHALSAWRPTQKPYFTCHHRSRARHAPSDRKQGAERTDRRTQLPRSHLHPPRVCAASRWPLQAAPSETISHCCLESPGLRILGDRSHSCGGNAHLRKNEVYSLGIYHQSHGVSRPTAVIGLHPQLGCGSL